MPKNDGMQDLYRRGILAAAGVAVLAAIAV